MVAVLSTNTIYSRDNKAPAPAVREDGSNYPWRMFFDENQRIVDADTTTELLEYLIPDYDILTVEERKAARVDLARSVQQLARASIIASLSPEAAEKIAEWEWNLLTYGEGENQDPYGWEDGTGELGVVSEEGIDQWNSPHPLVLLDTSYAPYTDIIPPLSNEGDYKEVKNIIWLRPEGEESLLRSLSRIGYITFGSPSTVTAAELTRKH